MSYLCMYILYIYCIIIFPPISSAWLAASQIGPDWPKFLLSLLAQIGPDFFSLCLLRLVACLARH